MYKLKMGDIVFMFSTELDALKALCLLLFMINDKFDKTEVLQARVVLDDLERTGRKRGRLAPPFHYKICS